MTDNIFQDNSQQNQDDTTDPLTVLVGEGRKYQTPEQLAQAYISADSFIEKLKQENAEMREKLRYSKGVEDVLDALQEQQPQRQNDSIGEEQESTKDLPTSTSKGLSVEELREIVRAEIIGTETAKTKENNLRQADALMKQHFGEKAAEVYKTKAVSPELHRTLLSLAEVSPKEFVNLFIEKQENNTAFSSSGGGINTAAIGNQQGQSSIEWGTARYYSELRKKEPNKYYAAATQLEMHNQALKDPDRYFGRK